MPLRTKPLAGLLLLPAALAAQGTGWELHLGRWYNGNRANVYEFRTSSRSGGGPFTHGFGASVLVNDSLGRRRAFYGLGYELQAWRGQATLGPYALAGLALGLSTDPSTQELAAQWSIGGGFEWRPLSWFGVGSEVRYRLEDRGPRGFWNPRSDARKGVSLSIGVSMGLGGVGRGGGGGGRGPDRGRHPSCHRRSRRRRSPGTPPTWFRPRSNPSARRTSGAARRTTGSIAPA